MLIELTTLPIEIQNQIGKIEQGETVAFAKNGKVYANIQPVKRSAYDVIMSYDFPEDVADIELELPLRQMSNQKILEIFD